MTIIKKLKIELIIKIKIKINRHKGGNVIMDLFFYNTLTGKKRKSLFQ